MKDAVLILAIILNILNFTPFVLFEIHILWDKSSGVSQVLAHTSKLTINGW